MLIHNISACTPSASAASLDSLDRDVEVGVGWKAEGSELNVSEGMPEKHGAITRVTFWLVKNVKLLRCVLCNCALVQQNAVF